MKTLADFPVTRRWAPQHPDRLQLYTLGTPNGVKVSIALEEIGLPYEAHRVAFDRNDQLTPEFLSLNPNNKIPAIIDPDGPDGAPMPLWESGAILLYLADKCGKLMPKDRAGWWQTVQWIMFQKSAVGPMFGQVGFFHHFAGKHYEDKRPLKRYVDETRRLLSVLDARLSGRDWVMDEYTMADIAIFPWVWNVVENYKAGHILEIDQFPNVLRAHRTFMARPAVIRGMKVPAKSNSE